MKKAFKTLVILIFSAMVIAATAVPGRAAAYTTKADELYQLGIFYGTGNGFELDRESARSEAAAMLVRLLGKEDDAQAGSYQHPFIDVPDWADKYVGYLYANGLTAGTSATTFSPDMKCDATMYATFILRSLGYSEGSGDFTYSEAPDFAIQMGLIDQAMAEKKPFLRDDLAAMSYSALFQKPRNSGGLLLDKLMSENAVNSNTANELSALYASYQEYLSVYEAGLPADSIKLRQNTSFSIGVFGQTENQTVNSVITIADGSGGTMVKTEDEYNYSGEEMSSTSYYADGWVYTISGNDKYKYQDTPPAVEDFLMETGPVPFYLISRIHKSTNNGETSYDIVYTRGAYNDLASMLMQMIGDESVIVNIPNSTAQLTTTFDAGGEMKAQNFDLVLGLNVKQGDITYPFDMSLHMNLEVLATGNSVELSLPSDLDSYPEIETF